MRMRYRSAASFAALCLVPGWQANAAAAEMCPAPSKAPSKTHKSGAHHASTDPLALKMADADDARQAGRDARAKAMYTRLANVPENRRQTARRAKLRLAQFALQDDDFATARSLISSAAAPGARDSVMRQAAYLRRRIAYEEARNKAVAELASVDAARTHGDATPALISRYSALLDVPCPYPADYKVRIHERLSRLYLDSDDYVAARKELQRADDAVVGEDAQRVNRIRARIAQSVIDLDATQALDSADAQDDPAKARSIYEGVIQSPAGRRPDDRFVIKAHYGLADLFEDDDKFDQASAQYDAAQAMIDPTDAQALADLRQRRTDLHAEEIYARSDAVRRDDPVAQRALLARILALDPPPSPAVLQRARYRMADSFARNRKYDDARDELAQAKSAIVPGDLRGAERYRKAAGKVAQIEIDTRAKDDIDLHQGERSAHPRRAIAGMRSVIDREPHASAKVRDSARLTLADTLRREGYYAQSGDLIGQVLASPADEMVAQRATLMQGRLAEDTPRQTLHGSVAMGVFYDTNAPTLVSELRTDENDTGYPLDRRFDDGVAELRGSLTHQIRMDSNYDYWRTDLNLMRTQQFSLTNLNRTVVNVATGPVFNVPAQRASISVTGRFNWEQRGGRFLRDYFGLEIGAQRKINDQLTARGELGVLHNNDRRDGLSGEYYDVAAGMAVRVGQRSRIIPEVGFQIRDLDDGTLDSQRYSIRIAYTTRWGDDNREYGLAVKPRFQWIRYENDRSYGPRRDTKFDVSASAYVLLQRQYRIALDYRHLDPSSNYPGSNRLSDDRIGVSLSYEF